MKRFARISLIVLPMALVLLLSSITFAESVAGYDLSWWTVDGGGITCNTGGKYTLDGTAGQLDAGLLAGGGYTLGGGFWAGGAAVMHNVYLPIVLR